MYALPEPPEVVHVSQFYGERTGRFEGSLGHVWHISTRIENVSRDEMQRRFQGLLEAAGAS
jgi:PhnB protein